MPEFFPEKGFHFFPFLQFLKFMCIHSLVFILTQIVNFYLNSKALSNLFHRGSNVIGRWLEAFKFLFRGPDVLMRRYTSGGAYVVQTPERRYVVVSSEEQIRELARAPDEQLSLLATAEEMFQPKYTMNGVELHRLKMQHRILRVLTLKLPSLELSFHRLVQQAIATEITGGKTAGGWMTLRTFPVIKNIVGKANIYTFYGEQYINDPQFLASAIRYPQDVALAAEVLRCTPKPLAWIVAYVVTRGHQALRNLVRFLTPMIENRLEAGGFDQVQEPKPNDYVQWTIDTFPKGESKAAEKIVKQTLALWFASVHQPAMTLAFALYDLCVHPEYIEPLRQEILVNMTGSGEMDLNNMPLLDSFFKESARLNASESISLRRKAMVPYKFHDGTYVPTGDWACVPQRALMRDPAIYPNATTFDGFRFVDSEKGDTIRPRSRKFTDLDPFYPFWGLGKQACPGRFYAAFIMKIICAHILLGYDIELADPTAPRTFSWRSGIVPYAHTALRIRERLLPEST